MSTTSTIVMTPEEITAFYADTNQRGQYPIRLRKFKSDGNIGENVTEEFSDRSVKLASVAAGMKQQLAKEEFAGILVLYHPANTEKGTAEQLVLYNKGLHDKQLTETEEPHTEV